MTTNPFEVEEELFDKARSGFIGMGDCVDRLILIYPIEIRQAVGNDGNRYDKCIADVVILTGAISETFPTIPFNLDGMHINNGTTVDKCKANLRAGRGRPILGVVAETPSKINKKVMANFLVAPSEEDIATATSYLKDHPRMTESPFDQ